MYCQLLSEYLQPYNAAYSDNYDLEICIAKQKYFWNIDTPKIFLNCHYAPAFKAQNVKTTFFLSEWHVIDFIKINRRTEGSEKCIRWRYFDVNKTPTNQSVLMRYRFVAYRYDPCWTWALTRFAQITCLEVFHTFDYNQSCIYFWFILFSNNALWYV